MGVNLYTSGTLTVKSGTTLKSTLHVDGESGFYGKVTARSSFAFLDYNAEEDANANAVFRRPIASAGSNKTKVAFLQSQAGIYIMGHSNIYWFKFRHTIKKRYKRFFR